MDQLWFSSNEGDNRWWCYRLFVVKNSTWWQVQDRGWGCLCDDESRSSKGWRVGKENYKSDLAHKRELLVTWFARGNERQSRSMANEKTS